MKQGNFLKIFRPRTLIYFICLIAFSGVMFIYNPFIAGAELLLVALLVLYSKIFTLSRNEKISEYLKDLSLSSDSITKNFALNSVFPLAILKNDNDVIWYNNKFEEIFLDETKSKESAIGEIIPGFPSALLGKSNFVFPISFKEREFRVEGSSIKESSADAGYSMLYFIECTEEKRLESELESRKIVFGKIVIDNYEETIGALSEGDRAVIIAELDKHIFGWSHNADAFIKKLEKDKFLIIFEKKNLNGYIEHEFEKLRNLKECLGESNVNVTLSVGVGYDGATPIESNAFSSSSIDMALGRGGDQVVVKNAEGFSFYGGGAKEVEKRTKVRSRVIAHALKELIESNDNVVVMGHKNADMDYIGSALGIYRAARTFGKKCYIVLDEISPSIRDLINIIQEEEEYSDLLITKSQAEILLEEGGMLVITDTHRLSLMPYPELTERTESVVLIDHHRKSADFYSKALLTYHEPYASSASELTVEILQYISDDLKLTNIESSALYAGILLDTQNFTFKTGVRTFEAASYLRRCGLDTAEAKELLKSDINNYVLRNQIISSAQIYKNSIAISAYDGNIKDKAVPSQAANELLNIKGITTTFVIYSSGNGQYSVSARSIGDINVQLIMEKLGGGGHQLSAGAQISVPDINEAVTILKMSIDDYLNNQKIVK